MKKFLIMAVAVMTMLTACDSKKTEEEQNAAALQDVTRQELEAAVANRDSLLSLVNEIASGMEQIKSLENILTTNGVGDENSNERARILADMSAIQKTLAQRKQQLADLEAKLKNSNLTNSNLKKTIETLHAQIEAQTA